MHGWLYRTERAANMHDNSFKKYANDGQMKMVNEYQTMQSSMKYRKRTSQSDKTWILSQSEKTIA